jgi:hypothetical protein
MIIQCSPTAVALCGRKWKPLKEITQLGMNTVPGHNGLRRYLLSCEQRHLLLTVLTFGDVKGNCFARWSTELWEITTHTPPWWTCNSDINELLYDRSNSLRDRFPTGCFHFKYIWAALICTQWRHTEASQVRESNALLDIAAVNYGCIKILALGEIIH